MAKEIERKFLLAADVWRQQATGATAITQFYLAVERSRTVRLRIREGKEAVLTLKFGTNDRARDEFEYAVPLADAEEMRAFAVGRVIEKTRHIVPHQGYSFEVDEFHGELAGLVLAELETPDDVPDERLPDWIGREVTGETAYYNASLALVGRPGDAVRA